jgi:hypothetical protein
MGEHIPRDRPCPSAISNKAVHGPMSIVTLPMNGLAM